MPGQITYATGGSGTANHIATEALRAATGIVHVPCKGHQPGGSRRPALGGGAAWHHPAGSDAVPAVGPAAPDRHHQPEARAGTPPAVMSKLNADALKALQSAEVRKQLASADIEYVGSTPEQCEAFVHEQVAGETDRQGIGGESGLVCCRPEENNSTVPVPTLAMNYPTY